MDSDSSHSIAVTVEAEAWHAAVTDPEGLSRRVVGRVLTLEAMAGEVSVLLADDARLQALNRDWRAVDRPTNVLSFPSGDAPFLGDLALALETARAEAAAEGKPLDHHLSHLLVHGTLHLLGYDHEEDAAAEAMESRETELLAALGIADPYRLEAVP